MKKAHDAKNGSNNDRYGDNDEFHYLCQVTDITSGNSKSFSIKSKKEPKDRDCCIQCKREVSCYIKYM